MDDETGTDFAIFVTGQAHSGTHQADIGMEDTPSPQEQFEMQHR
jgi:hypothetical protein